MRICVLVLIAVALAPARPAGAATLTAADRQWIDRCIAQIAIEKSEPKAVRTYCTCMHEMYEDNEKVSQTDMEHMFPPVHCQCHDKADWK